MLRRDLHGNIDQLYNKYAQYLFYVSQNNAWVLSGADIYKVTIKSMEVEGKASVNISETEMIKLKKYLSRCATCMTPITVNPHINEIVVDDLRLTIKSMKCSRLDVSYGVRDEKRNKILPESMRLNLSAENFDYLFFNQMNLSVNSNSLGALSGTYEQQKNDAYSDAVKNMIWQAASMGDASLLEKVFDHVIEVGLNADVLNDTYHGKSLLEAMYDADPKVDGFMNIIPAFNPKINYSATLDLLVKHGLSDHSIKSFYDQMSQISRVVITFFSGRGDRNEILPLLAERLSASLSAGLSNSQVKS